MRPNTIKRITLMMLGLTALATIAASLKSVMHDNFEALMDLQPYAASPEKFADPKNKPAIQKDLDTLSHLEHVIPENLRGHDPGRTAIASIFSNYVGEIQREFRSGSTGALTRNKVQTMTGLCMSCHTQLKSEQSFIDTQKKVESLSLSQLEKAEFYAATRQFDRALAIYKNILSVAPQTISGYRELPQALREALSITIRIKQDPKTTYDLLDTLSKREDIPDDFQRYITEWKQDAARWMNEKPIGANPSAEGLIKKSEILVNHAQQARLFNIDPSGDVSYLRATNYLHEALTKNPNNRLRGEALYLLGTAYSGLQDPLLWNLDPLYFEACIKEFPHSELAQKCYHRYSTKIYFGYTGSGGTFIPEDEIRRLQALSKLAKVTKSESKQSR